MAFRQRRPWIGSSTASSYNVGSWVLLLDSVIDIATSSTSLRWSFPSVGSQGVGFPGVGSPGVGLGFVTSVAMCFCGLSLGLGSPAGAFLFDEGAVSNGHLLNSLAPCSDSSMYGSLAIITCFVVSGLYSMRMPCQTLWQSDFDLFSFGILHKARLPNIQTC